MATRSMSWQIRHQGSPRTVAGLTVNDIAEGLRDGLWEPTDEVHGPADKGWQPIEDHPQFAELVAELDSPPPKRRDEGTNLDMNALIDVCLVLLIFFILTTTYATAVQKIVPMPTVQSDSAKARTITQQDVKKRMIRMKAFKEKGNLVVHIENQLAPVVRDDGQAIDDDKLRDALRPYVKGEDGKTEVLLDARQISWGTAIAIHDAVKSAGVRQIRYLQGTRRTPVPK